ncbi:hypothetical protein [Bacillus wiedmannii]|nr:hypothetical protein [Bacillus wiedmannii]
MIERARSPFGVLKEQRMVSIKIATLVLPYRQLERDIEELQST